MEQEHEQQQAANGHILPRWGFLYTDGQPISIQAAELLKNHNVDIYQCDVDASGEHALQAPTFVTREGIFAGLEGIEAYIAWSVPGFATIVYHGNGRRGENGDTR